MSVLSVQTLVAALASLRAWEKIHHLKATEADIFVVKFVKEFEAILGTLIRISNNG